VCYVAFPGTYVPRLRLKMSHAAGRQLPCVRGARRFTPAPALGSRLLAIEFASNTAQTCASHSLLPLLLAWDVASRFFGCGPPSRVVNERADEGVLQSAQKWPNATPPPTQCQYAFVQCSCELACIKTGYWPILFSSLSFMWRVTPTLNDLLTGLNHRSVTVSDTILVVSES
jgi:hypothetical protein